MNSQKMRTFLFVVFALCILGAVFVSVLAIWGYVGTDAAWKTVATVGVIMLGCFAFGAANDQFINADDDDDF